MAPTNQFLDMLEAPVMKEAKCYRCKKEFPKEELYLTIVPAFVVEPGDDINLFVMAKYKDSFRDCWVVSACKKHSNPGDRNLGEMFDAISKKVERKLKGEE